MRVRLLSLASTGLLCLLACAGGERAVTPAPGASVPATAPLPAADVAALRLAYAGTWRSPACGLRNHEQVIELRSDGSFHLEDRISPCPEGIVCVWSGVEAMDGQWQLDGDAIDLAPAGEAPAIARPPTRLRWEPAPAGVEAPAGSLEDQRGCLFLRDVPKPAEPPPQPAEPHGTPTQAPAPAAGETLVPQQAGEPATTPTTATPTPSTAMPTAIPAPVQTPEGAAPSPPATANPEGDTPPAPAPTPTPPPPTPPPTP